MNWYTNTWQVYSRYDVDTWISHKPPVMFVCVYWCGTDEIDSEIRTETLILLGTKIDVLKEGNGNRTRLGS